MTLTAVADKISFLTGYFKTELAAIHAKHLLEQQVNETSCYDKDIVMWNAAFIEASLIKLILDRDSSVDWRTQFKYTEHKKCLKCKNINYDKILTAVGIDLAI